MRNIKFSNLRHFNLQHTYVICKVTLNIITIMTENIAECSRKAVIQGAPCVTCTGGSENDCTSCPPKYVVKNAATTGPCVGKLL